jgi:hypothetical protein
MPGKDLAFSTDLHLLTPVLLRLPAADRPVDKPAEMACLEFPRRASFAGLGRTIPNVPAGPNPLHVRFLHRQQKQHLSFNVHGNLAPPLLEALNRLDRGPEQFGKLLLRLLKLLPKCLKFMLLHSRPLPGAYQAFLTKLPHCGTCCQVALGKNICEVFGGSNGSGFE